MQTGIGATLRETRKRRELDLPEVEAAIKIRLRYLRAMEDEDWDVLPGGAYTRGFIRTYAAYLGLDGERLADEYRRGSAADGERAPRRAEPLAGVPGPARERRFSGRARTAVVSLLLLGLAVAIGLLVGGDDGSQVPSPDTAADGERRAATGERAAVASRSGVSLGLAATAEVWACVLDGDGKAVLDGEILQPGAQAGPFRAARFTAAFGNGEVELTIDGEQAATPPSASPVGYEVEPDGDLKPLGEGERPDCE